MIQPQWSTYREQVNLLQVIFEKKCQETPVFLQVIRLFELKNINVEVAQI